MTREQAFKWPKHYCPVCKQATPKDPEATLECIRCKQRYHRACRRPLFFDLPPLCTRCQASDTYERYGPTLYNQFGKQ